MQDQITCPFCNKPIPLTQALSHQVQEKYRQFFAKRLAEEKEKIGISLREELGRKIKSELELQMKDKVNESEELKKQNRMLQEQLLELNKLIRQLKTDNEQKSLEMEKRLTQSQEKIRAEEQKRLDEEYHLKMLEREKKLQDALKMNEELKRKLEQGSEQSQGEVLELEIENILRREFPYDDIKEVPKGITGADIIQIVKTVNGRVCGTIIWESKRTKIWSDSWVTKLKDDQRQVKAELSVIISQTLPPQIKNFGLISDVWIGNYDSILGLAISLRNSLEKLSSMRQSMVGKQEKKEILWNYLTGVEFKQRVEAIYEAYMHLKQEIDMEKRWFTKKWAREEKSIAMVIDNVLGMHGDLQGIVGKALSEIKEMEQLEAGEEHLL